MLPHTFGGKELSDLPFERKLGDGSLAYFSELGAPIPRRHLERFLPSPASVGLKGWQRVHSHGPGTGHESDVGIYYATRAFNLEYQARVEHFERMLVDMAKQCRPQRTLVKMTVTRGHPKEPLILDQIEYVVFAIWGDRCVRVCELCIRQDILPPEGDRLGTPEMSLMGQHPSKPKDLNLKTQISVSVEHLDTSPFADAATPR